MMTLKTLSIRQWKTIIPEKQEMKKVSATMAYTYDLEKVGDLLGFHIQKENQAKPSRLLELRRWK